MAEVFGTASAAAGLLSLTIQLFDGCIKGFVLLSTAKGLGSRAEAVSCQLEWEHFNLNCWAHIVGLHKDPPELNITAGHEDLVARTLRNLEAILTDAEKLKDNYNLSLAITEEEVHGARILDGLFRSTIDAASGNSSDAARVYRRRNSAWKKLTWAAFDETRFRNLIADVHYFNQQLQNSLHWSEKDSLSRDTNEALRTLIALTADRTILEVVIKKIHTPYDALKAAAELKEQGLLSGLLGAEQPAVALSKKSILPLGATPPISLQIDAAQIKRQEHSCFTIAREVVEYRGAPVIVEWKDVLAAQHKYLKYRVINLTHLLSKMNDASFHTLKCLGYVKVSKRLRYGYLFELPQDPDLHLQTLSTCLTSKSFLPSLNQRLSLSIVLIETVLQLHTASWLHKSIRADNVLTFQPSQENENPSFASSHIYLGGYDLARADDLHETTEAPRDEEADQIYRHSLSVGRHRHPFCRAFDLYSLGCVLVEIGLWRAWPALLAAWTIFKNEKLQHFILPPIGHNVVPTSISEWHDVAQEIPSFMSSIYEGEVGRELSFAMGDIYVKVARRCLQCASASNPATPEKDVLSIEIENLRLLRDMCRRV